jgi:hypothetical protein
MNKGLIIGAAIAVSSIAVIATSYITANNYGVSVEAQLVAARDNNQNILAQYEQRVLEIVQVPDMYKNDLKEIVQATMQGRYGADGSKAMFQWIQEQNLQLDSSVYTRIQDTILAGRKDFELAQTRMIDIRRGYDQQLGFFWRGLWLDIAGFPRVNLADFKPVVTNRVLETFETRIETSPLKLR